MECGTSRRGQNDVRHRQRQFPEPDTLNSRCASMCGPPPWSFPLPSAGSPVDCTAARTAKGFPVGGKVSSGCGRFGRGSLNNRNSDELYTELRSRSISDSLEPRKHRYLRLGEQVARVPLALYVHLSSRNLGSSGVSVGCCLGEDAKLAAAPLAQGPFSRPREAATEGAPPARHGGWGARATRRNSHRNSWHSSQPNSQQQCTRMAKNGAERPFPPICVHSFAPTATLVTGRGHGSHDIDGPMAPVMPGRSDLRSTPPGR